MNAYRFIAALYASGHTGTIADPAWSAQAVQLGGGGGVSDVSYNGGQGSAGAAPTSLSSDGASFAVSVDGQSSGSQTSGSAGGTGGYGYGGYGYGGGDYGYGGYPGGYGVGAYPGGSYGYGDGYGAF